MGEEKSAVRIGFPYGSTNRIVIKTANSTYLLFTTNPASIMNKKFLNKQIISLLNLSINDLFGIKIQ